MRQELIDLVFHLAEQYSPPLNGDRLYRIGCQSLGLKTSGQPYAYYRHAVGRDIAGVKWPRVYDLICRLWPEFQGAGVTEDYRIGVNHILAGNGVVWDLNVEGRIQRNVPAPAQALIDAAIAELSASRFAPALALFDTARDAFDDRPRRDRDACSNIFDSMESVAKEVFNMPTATFGGFLSHVQTTRTLLSGTTAILQALNTLRNRKFGHGMTTTFDLSPNEVDFTYLACIGAILVFARL